MADVYYVPAIGYLNQLIPNASTNLYLPYQGNSVSITGTLPINYYEGLDPYSLPPLSTEQTLFYTILMGIALYDQENPGTIKNYLTWEYRPASDYSDLSESFTADLAIRIRAKDGAIVNTLEARTECSLTPGFAITPTIRYSVNASFRYGYYTDNNTSKIGLHLCISCSEADPLNERRTYYGFSMSVPTDILNDATFKSTYGAWFLQQSEDPTYDPSEGESDEGETKGGEGEKERDYDPVPIPDIPTVTAAGAGFFTMYHLNAVEMSVFANEMFEQNWLDKLKQLFNNPMDFIAGCHILPFTPPGTSMWYPKFGTDVWSSAYQKVDQSIVDISMGSIDIKPYWGSAYDYSPYTKLMIWLPYCGYKDLNPDEVMGKTLTVTYRVDVATGACVAFVAIGVVGATGPQVPRVLAQMTGNLATPVPVSQVSYDGAVRNAISLLATGATLAVGAAVAPAAAGVLAAGGSSLVSAATSAVTSSKPNVNRNGTIGASTGYMGVQTPYLLRFIPRLSLPSNYKKLKGYPSNMGGTLSSFSGYTEIADIKLDGINATQEEIEELKTILQGGVYL